MKLSIIGSSVFAGLAASQSCNPLADASSSVNAVSGYANIPSQYTVIQPDPSGNPYGTCLKLGQAIQECWRLTSPAGLDYLLLQPDGNVVHYSVYNSFLCNNNLGCLSAMWASGTSGVSYANALRFKNGQLWLTNTTSSANQIWVAPFANAANLCVQNSAHFYVYDATGRVIYND